MFGEKIYVYRDEHGKPGSHFLLHIPLHYTTLLCIKLNFLCRLYMHHTLNSILYCLGFIVLHFSIFSLILKISVT